jgi:hypothetical protein
MFLLSLLVTNHYLLTIRFCHVKVVNSIRVYSGGQSRLPRSPNRTPPKIYPLISLGHFFLYGVALALFQREYCLHASSQNFTLSYTFLSEQLDNFLIRPSKFACLCRRQCKESSQGAVATRMPFITNTKLLEIRGF